ncbi:MAG: hypothetical protein EOP34_10800 [Rickettsiales bacterium]|nr:MAG: hypothetical protein EOP34_10800 [Rickettsiales bacterium]
MKNIAIAFPNLRTQRAARLNKQKKIDFTAKIKKQPTQIGLFDYIETVNSISKDEFVQMIEPDGERLILKSDDDKKPTDELVEKATFGQLLGAVTKAGKPE